ncbi:MAG: hypothetical protein GY940_06650, partial [bacterium]|nr:hypothetical protein [bacterium]
MSRRKSLFVRHYEYICDENSNGKPSNPRLPATIFLAAACCESKGHDVSVLSVVDEPDFDVRNHDTVVAWVPLYEGFDLHVEYLRRAKEYSKRTVMILNEPLATFEREALETYPFIDVVIRQEEREYVLEQVLSELEKDIRCREFEFPG